MFDPGQHPLQRVNRLYAQQAEQINNLRSELEADQERRAAFIRKVYANDTDSMNFLLDELNGAYTAALRCTVLVIE